MDAKSDDNRLVHSCLQQRPFAWQQFVDHYLPVVLQVVHEIDVQTSQGWSEDQHHEFVREVFRQLRANDFESLRNWQSDTDFQSYLVIATRRIILADKSSSHSELGPDSASGENESRKG